MAIPKESMEQVTFLNEFKKEWPNVLIHSIPNGGLRNKSVAQQMKLEGLVSGVPDLFIPEWALWVEMKRQKGGSLGKEQKKIIPILEGAGYLVIVPKGYIDAINQIRDLHSKNQLAVSFIRG